uniref:Secreted protein n=1 Tax=Sus scrofa TaxID=9823 RepID=A0A8D0WRS9_PIG
MLSCFLSFFLFSLSLSLILFTTAATDLSVWYTSSNSTFSSNVMTFLCFFESISSIASGTLYGPHGVIQVYNEHDKKCKRTARDCFLLEYAVFWRDILLTRE